jgi:hypothetical protein
MDGCLNPCDADTAKPREVGEYYEGLLQKLRVQRPGMWRKDAGERKEGSRGRFSFFCTHSEAGRSDAVSA